MTSDSASHVPTQQSVKAYVDTEIRDLGAWSTVTVDGAAVQASTDGFIVGFITGVTGGVDSLQVKTDSSATPSTIRARASSGVTGDKQDWDGSIFSPVKRSDYYQVVTSTVTGSPSGGTTTAYFIPLS